MAGKIKKFFFVSFLTLALGAFAYGAQVLFLFMGFSNSNAQVRTKIKKGFLLPPDEPFRFSPFVTDSVFSEGESSVVMFDNPDNLSLTGEGAETWRFFAEGKGTVDVRIKLRNTDKIPRAWLYNDENQMVPGGKTSIDKLKRDATLSLPIMRPGMHKIVVRLDYANVRQIAVHSFIRRRVLSYRQYVAGSIKTFQLRIEPAQLERLKQLRLVQKIIWTLFSWTDAARRNLPSPKERILTRIKAGSGTWAYATIGLAGRSPEHATTNLLPSMDVRVFSGALPYGLKQFKLYILSAKTSGRDMMMESLLADYGVMMNREDIVKVTLNGRFTGFMQLMEDVDAPFFEFSQQGEGGVIGYEADSLLKQKSEFVEKSFYKKRTNPTGIMTAGALCDVPMLAALSFALTYAGNHGMGQADLRFYKNTVSGCVEPVPRDFNSGTNPLGASGDGHVYRSFFSALTALGTMSPEWRPDTATFSSYFVQKTAKEEAHDLFLWWSAMPLTMNFLGNEKNYSKFIAWMKRWELPADRKKVSGRLNYFGLAAKYLDEQAGTTLYGQLERHLPPFFQSVIPSSTLKEPLASMKDVKEDKNIRYLADMIKISTEGEAVPGSYSLSMFRWRNKVADAILAACAQDDKACMEETSYLNKPAQANVFTFFYRKEMQDKTILLFAGRRMTDSASGLMLADEHGNIIKPSGSYDFGSKEYSIKRKDLYLNDIKPDERVRVVVFSIKKQKEYQYFTAEVSGSALYLGPERLAVVPYPRPPVQQAFLPLSRFMTQKDGILTWRNDAPVVDGPVEIPADTDWVVRKPLEIRFGKNGCFIVHGAIHIMPEASLHLTPSEKYWAGIHFQNNKDIYLEHLLVENAGWMTNTGRFECGGREYTDGVSFYNTRAVLKNVEIRHALSEDALHFTFVEGVLDNVKIHSTDGDSVDLDYSKVSADRLWIQDAGKVGSGNGDGFDICGSGVNITRSHISGSEDKNVSAGENTWLTLSNSMLTGAEIGVAVKDASYVEISESRIAGADFGVAAYSKKPVFEFPHFALKKNITFVSNHADVRTFTPPSTPPLQSKGW